MSRGYHSCDGSTITVYDDIICKSYFSCDETSLNVYTSKNGDQSVFRVVVTDCNCNSVYCYSQLSCRNATIATVPGLYCFGFVTCYCTHGMLKYQIHNGYQRGGEGALYQANITGVAKIDLFGYIALRYSTIMNNGLTSMTVSLYGYWDGKDCTIICNTTGSSENVCTIYCYENTACAKFNSELLRSMQRCLR